MLPLLPVFRLGGESWILSHTDHSDFPSDKTEYGFAITVTSNWSRYVCSMLFSLKLVFVSVLQLKSMSCNQVKHSSPQLLR